MSILYTTRTKFNSVIDVVRLQDDTVRVMINKDLVMARCYDKNKSITFAKECVKALKSRIERGDYEGEVAHNILYELPESIWF
jgi:anti-sigma28 factor (negative regulator of flagellin synthesis)